MRNRKTQGFTLIELLIVIAIIGILAAVLIPNLLSARQRAFDTAAQTCLKEIATNEEMLASIDPWEYSNAALVNAGTGPLTVTVTNSGGAATPVSINSCDGVEVVAVAPTAPATALTWYGYDASHNNGGNTYRITLGQGVAHQATGILP